ncbi:MAG: monovalent cation/H(+) antiporter subunit G [Thermomicrobiales bacterium]|nr:monovalent cation/H(+) antiporter subunit G [Thermomicrobiales bacterium]
MNGIPPSELISDAFVLLGLVVMTIGVIGIVRMPDVYTKLHAAAKSVFLGVCSFLVAVSFSGDPGIIARAVLIGILLIFTTPVSAHEIARAAAKEQLARIENQGELPGD